MKLSFTCGDWFCAVHIKIVAISYLIIMNAFIMYKMLIKLWRCYIKQSINNKHPIQSARYYSYWSNTHETEKCWFNDKVGIIQHVWNHFDQLPIHNYPDIYISFICFIIHSMQYAFELININSLISTRICRNR